MLEGLLRKFVGSRTERELKKIQPAIEAINALEPRISGLSDADLQAKTPEFKQRIAERFVRSTTSFPKHSR